MKPTDAERHAADRTIVFVIGAPRSGTTYLQNLLGSQAQVVTSQETDLFTQYIAAWRGYLGSAAPGA